LGVQLHDRLRALGWIIQPSAGKDTYDLSRDGASGLSKLGIDVDAMRRLRRRFAFACLDWSERRSHLGGAVGAALLKLALKRKWVISDPESRALSVTRHGRREMLLQFGLRL